MGFRTLIVAGAVRARKFFQTVLPEWFMSNRATLAAEDESRKEQGTQTESRHVDESEMDKLSVQVFTCPLILAGIFKNLDVGRVKKCRLVCKAWNEEICRSRGRRNWVLSYSLSNGGTINGLQNMIEEGRNQKLPLPFAEVDLVGRYKLTRESNLWLNGNNFKITGLSLHVVTQSGPFKLKYESPDSLVQTYSATLTKLRVQFSSVSTISQESLSLPRLEELCLESSFDPPNHLAQSASFSLWIISAAPKLRSLNITNPSLAAEILRRADLSSLKQLEIRGCVELELSPDLGSLQQLSVWQGSWAGDALDETKRVLSRFTSRLQTLTIRSTPVLNAAPSGVNPSTFPIFPHLKTLELDRYNPRGLNFSCFPSLTHFKCSCVVVVENVNNAPFPLRSLSVRTVSLRRWESTGNDGPQRHKLAYLSSSFPKAHTWELPFNAAPSFCIPALSYGMEVKTLLLHLAHRRAGREEHKLLHDDMYVFAYLEHLKDLETLGLFSDCKKYQKEINWKALNLDKMQNLKTLMLRFSPSNKLDDIPNFKDFWPPEIERE